MLRINGQAVKLRGVNRHDEYPDVGRAVGRKHWLEDLQKMKQANVNYVRACHYQHAKGFIELCDSIGMYVGAEVSLGGASQLMYDPSFISHVMLRCQETVGIPIRNDYDFLTLSDVTIDWRVMVDERTVGSGSGTVDAAPHGVANLAVDVKGVGVLTAEQTAYVQLVIKRAGGEEIARKYVELKPATALRSGLKTQKMTVENKNGHVLVKVGTTTVDYSPETGLPVSITKQGRKTIDGLRPTIWHRLNEGDQIIKNRTFAKGVDPEVMTAEVLPNRTYKGSLTITDF